MSDPFDALPIAGTATVSGTLMFVAARWLLGSVVTDLKEKMNEVRAALDAGLVRVEATVNKHGDRLESLRHDLTLCQAQAAEAHRRIDVIERDLREIDSRCVLVHGQFGGKKP